MRIKRPSKKFNYRKINLFFIKVIKKLQNTKQLAKNYKFNLLRDANIHLVFDVRFLKLIYPDILLQTIFYYKTDQNKKYKVEKIVGEKPG